MSYRVADVLAGYGVTVTAAPELLVNQELLERLSDLLLKFIARWQKTSTSPAWFFPQHRISKHFLNAVHAFQLYRIAYPNVEIKQIRPDDEYAMFARALRVKPTPEMLASSGFRTLAHIFWHLTVVFTEDGCVNTLSTRGLSAAYIGEPLNALALPVYRGTQRFGAAPNAEADSSKDGTVSVPRSDVIHELRHAVQDYSGSHIWEMSHLEKRNPDEEGVGRDYYLRPVEIDARLAELTAKLRRRIAELVRAYQTEASSYFKFARLLREGGDIPTAPGHKVTPEIVEMFRKSAVEKPGAAKLRRIFAPGGDGFMGYCEAVIKRDFPELHRFLGDDVDDLAKSYAVRHLHSELRELWADMQERYRNVLPTMKPELQLEPGEHFYQYGRPQEMR